MGLYDDKLNPTYEDVLVAFLPIKSVKIKYVIIKGAKKKPMHKKLHMGVSKQRDYVSGEEETNHRVYAIAVLINILLISQKIVAEKRKNIDKWRLFYGLCDPTRPDPTRPDVT